MRNRRQIRCQSSGSFSSSATIIYNNIRNESFGAGVEGAHVGLTQNFSRVWESHSSEDVPAVYIHHVMHMFEEEESAPVPVGAV